MATDHPALDPERQARAKAYGRLRRQVAVAETLFMLAYLAAWTLFGAAFSVAAWTQAALPVPDPFAVLGVGVALALPWLLLTLPLRVYTGYLLPHRFGQSNQSLSLWVADQGKGLFLSAAMGAPLLLALYAIMVSWPEGWWIGAGLGYTLFLAVFSTAAPVILMPLFYRFRPLAEDRADLAARLSSLARKAGHVVDRVVTFDMSRRTVGANAALVGLGRTRSILVGDTLLSSFTDDEVETVLAHELAHHVHRDLAWGIALQGSLALVSFGVTASVLKNMVRQGTLAAPGDPAGLPYLALALAAAGLILLPLQNAFSRTREARADAYAVHLTHRPRAYADALVRLANQNLAEVNPPRWSVILFATHPPMEERIRAARLAESRPGQRPMAA